MRFEICITGDAKRLNMFFSMCSSFEKSEMQFSEFLTRSQQRNRNWYILWHIRN